MGHHLKNISFLHQELTKKLNISTNKAKELKVGLLNSSFLTLDIKPVRFQMAQKWDCLTPARFRLVLQNQRIN